VEFAANALDRREFLELFSESSLSETTFYKRAHLVEYDKVEKPDQAEENCNRHEVSRALAALGYQVKVE
jgi:hypothetical protein